MKLISKINFLFNNLVNFFHKKYEKKINSIQFWINMKKINYKKKISFIHHFQQTKFIKEKLLINIQFIIIIKIKINIKWICNNPVSIKCFRLFRTMKQ